MSQVNTAKSPVVILLLGLVLLGLLAYLFLLPQPTYAPAPDAAPTSTELDTLTAEIESLKRETEALRTKLSATLADATADTALPTPDGIDMTEMMQNFLASSAGLDEGEGASVPDIMNMAKSFAENPAFVKMMVKQEYAGLFERLGLPTERQDELMAVLIEHAQKNYADAFEGSAFKMPGDEDPLKKELRDAVAKVLRPNEMATFDDYEEHKHEYMMREQMMMELGYLSSQVSEENLHRFVDIQLQNNLTLFENFADPTAFMDGDFTEIFSLRIDSMQQSLDLLAPELTPEELQAFTRHIELQRMQAAQMEAMFERMGMNEQFQEMMRDLAPGE